MEQPRVARLPEMNHRFTLDGSDSLEAFLGSLCQEIAQAICSVIPAKHLKCLLLGGGYGRGEGGVLSSEEGDLPYNDLEFYVIHTRHFLTAQKLYGKGLHQLSATFSQKAGIDVEFKLLSLAQLEGAPVSMFYYDLVSRHFLVVGDESALENCGHHRAAHRIPLHEATRLLMNRCSGLFFSQQRLGCRMLSEDDSDFVYRNILKAKLALGDVILASRGEYHWSCLERHKRISKLETRNDLPEIQAITELHEEGVQFKLHPVRSTRSREELQAEFDVVSSIAKRVWLWLETRRLENKFGDVVAYALDSGDKCPETNDLKNRLINLRLFGVSGLQTGSYPRERLLRTLPLFLWARNFEQNQKQLKFIQDQLKAGSAEIKELHNRYKFIWEHYN